jgi:hypothetical protein
LPTFQLQQAFFERESAAEAREAAVMSDHAVARNNNRNRIRAIRAPTARTALGLLMRSANCL